MMTSQRCEPSVMRTNPVACGIEGIGELSCRVSPRKVRRACFRNLRPFRWRTADCSDRRRPAIHSDRRARGLPPAHRVLAPNDATGATIAVSAQQRRRAHQQAMSGRLGHRAFSIHSTLAETRVLPLLGGLGLVFVLGRPHPTERIVGARAQINKDVVDHAHHVLIVAERGHDVLVGGVHVLAAAGDHAEEVAVAHTS